MANNDQVNSNTRAGQDRTGIADPNWVGPYGEYVRRMGYSAIVAALLLERLELSASKADFIKVSREQAFVRAGDAWALLPEILKEARAKIEAHGRNERKRRERRK